MHNTETVGPSRRWRSVGTVRRAERSTGDRCPSSGRSGSRRDPCGLNRAPSNSTPLPRRPPKPCAKRPLLLLLLFTPFRVVLFYQRPNRVEIRRGKTTLIRHEKKKKKTGIPAKRGPSGRPARARDRKSGHVGPRNGPERPTPVNTADVRVRRACRAALSD